MHMQKLLLALIALTSTLSTGRRTAITTVTNGAAHGAGARLGARSRST